jgi:protein-S-isoprenylcysteine O-methyltransferase Ste14
MEHWHLSALIVGTVFFAWVTWQVSLRERRYHGIYRFFSFETILLLVIFNASTWFDDPFSMRQIVSWFFLLLSALLAIHGFYLIKVIGQPKDQIEDTTVLVKAGAFRYIRHPLCCSLLCGGLGAMLKSITPFTVSLMVINTLALVATARVEEKEMTGRFGDDYRQYMRSTTRFVPFVF